jgi:Pyruvate/2-oxoacid:ferredoxin oxidoreductase delta subunit
MCWLCDQFGDPEYADGLWYLNPKNYARNMYKLREPGQAFKGAGAAMETGERPGPGLDDVMRAIQTDKQAYEKVTQEWQDSLGLHGSGAQVVPMEDADKILELCSPIALIACICRKDWRARDERNEMEYTCMGMGVGMLKWERWPERYKGGVKFLNTEEAKEWNHEMDRRGFVHILMLFGAPYIGGFCQCDYPDCNAIRWRLDFGVSTVKGHHVAFVDYDRCNGCGVCAQRCQWAAIKFEVTTDKANIDQFKCFGCGLCQTGCPRKAITLVERKSLPALAGVW